MSTPSSQKRRRPSTSSTSSPPSMTELPELPKITGEVILETFTHRSLRVEPSTEHPSDNERLIAVGNKALSLAVTDIVFQRRPVVSAADFPTECDKILSEENFKIWVERYNLRSKLRYIPSDTIDICAPEETRALFEAYVGAVYKQSGMDVIVRWISRLVDPNANISDHEDGDEHEEYRPMKRTRIRTRSRTNVKTEEVNPDYNPLAPVSIQPTGFSPDSVFTGIPTVNTYAMQASPPSRPTIPSIKVTYLAAFHERCSQRQLRVEYEASNCGLSHAPRWVIKCFVNGVEKGQGHGNSKQIAKEEAAKMAFFGMGWGDFGSLPTTTYGGIGFTGTSHISLFHLGRTFSNQSFQG